MIFTNIFRARPPDIRAAAVRLRENNFDTLRFLFASMFVFFRVGMLSEVPSLSVLHNYVSSAFAVQAFFVVSSFLVTMSFENSSSVRSYAEKQIRRIAPAYVVVVIGAAFLLSMVTTLPVANYFDSRDFWSYVGFNLLLSNFSAPALPGVFQNNPQSAINGSLWTIKIEVAYYCFVPIFLWVGRRFGTMRVLIVMFLGSLAWRMGLSWFPEKLGIEFLARLAKQLPGQLCFFVGGSWAYKHKLDGHMPRVIWAILGIVAYIATSGTFHEIIAPVAVTAVVYWAAIAGPSLPAIGKYGDFSYGVYLYHFPIVQVLVAFGLFGTAPLRATLTLYAFATAAGVLSWFLVERPALKRKPSLTSERLSTHHGQHA